MHRSVIYGAFPYPVCFSPLSLSFSHSGRTPPYGLQNHETISINHLGGGGETNHKKIPRTPEMQLSKILGVIFQVTSKNFGKDKRELILTRQLHGCLLNYTLGFLSEFCFLFVCLCLFVLLLFWFFSPLCNCKERLLQLSIVPLQTYTSSQVSTPGLSQRIASFVSINSFYLECQRYANRRAFKRLFGQLGMINLLSVFRIGLS